jgi:hypothetical protein
MHQPTEQHGSGIRLGTIEDAAGVLPYFDQVLDRKGEADFTQAENELHPGRIYHSVGLWPRRAESVLIHGRKAP